MRLAASLAEHQARLQQLEILSRRLLAGFFLRREELKGRGSFAIRVQKDAAHFSARLFRNIGGTAAGAERGFEAEALGDAVLPLLAAEWAAAADGFAHGAPVRCRSAAC